MSSIRTADSGPPRTASLAVRDASSCPSGAARAAARSASFSAAHTQSTSARPASADSPATTPPPPRRLVSLPSAPRLNDTGPRLDAISTRPAGSALMEGEVRAFDQAGPEPGRRPADLFPSQIARCPHRLELSAQLHNAHPEGWRERPCEAPATTVTANATCWPLGQRRVSPQCLSRGRPPGYPGDGWGLLHSAALAQGGARHGRCQLRPAAVRPQGQMREKGPAP